MGIAENIVRGKFQGDPESENEDLLNMIARMQMETGRPTFDIPYAKFLADPSQRLTDQYPNPPLENIIGSLVQYYKEPKNIANTVADFIPGIGDAKNALETIIGRTAIGEPLNWWQRGLSGLGALPIIPSVAGIMKKIPTANPLERDMMRQEGNIMKKTTKMLEGRKKPEIIFDNNIPKDVEGYYDKGTNAIHISNRLSPERAKEVESHELKHFQQVLKEEQPTSIFVSPRESIKHFMEYLSDPAEVSARAAEKGETVPEMWNEIFKFREESMAGKPLHEIPLHVDKITPITSGKWVPDRPLPDNAKARADWAFRRFAGQLRPGDPKANWIESKAIRIHFKNQANGISAEVKLKEVGIEAFSAAPYSVDIPLTDINKTKLSEVLGIIIEETKPSLPKLSLPAKD